MSNRLGKFFKHISSALVEGVLFFITLSVMFKLFMKIEEWLLASLIWSISWVLGSLMAKLILYINQNTRGIWIFHSALIALVFVLLAFVLGVILNYPDWAELVSYITFPFGISVYSTAKKHS